MSSSTRAILVAVAGVLTAVGLVALMLLMAGGGQVEVRLGDDEFNAGNVERLAGAVERDGPILFPDASPGRARDLYLQHLGDTPDTGWVALAAQVPGAERECVLRWDAAERVFTDPCSDAEFAENGEGLPRYATRVEDGRLFVDLRSAAD
jgi:hypothetical protein